MESNRLQIAFISSSDPVNKKSWSGIHHYASQALAKHCGDINHLGQYHFKGIINKGKIISKVSKSFLNKRYDYTHSIALSKAYGKYYNKKLKEKHYDLIFCPAGSTEIAYLETDLPIFYLSDTTFANMIDYYPFYTNLLKSSIKQGLEIEQRAINKSKGLFYPSEWAADSAINDFKADKNKVHIIPLGANIDEVPDRESILGKMKTNYCRLLFLGVEWERKGGKIAYDAFLKLIEMGTNATLTIVGCIPPSNVNHPNIKVIPFIDKNDTVQRKQLSEILMANDFLLVPTRAECFGIVFCEASAYGIPSITTDTGGTEGAVKDSINGFLLPYYATGIEYAKVINAVYNNDEKYYSMIKSSRELYESKLNWDAWGIEVASIIKNMI